MLVEFGLAIGYGLVISELVYAGIVFRHTLQSFAYLPDPFLECENVRPLLVPVVGRNAEIRRVSEHQINAFIRQGGEQIHTVAVVDGSVSGEIVVCHG